MADQSAPKSAATMGNHCAVDAPSHVGVRSAVKIRPEHVDLAVIDRHDDRPVR